MEPLLYLLTLVTVTLITVVFYQFFFGKRVMVSERLQSIKAIGVDFEEDELKTPFIDRVIAPLVDRMAKAVGRMTPSGIKDKYETLIIQAGKQKIMNTNKLLLLQLVSAAIFGGLMYAVTILANLPALLFTAVMAFIGWMLPYVQYRSIARKRQEEIQVSLPSFLDLLYVSVEAGLGFDMAMKRSAEKMKGALAEEIRAVLDDISKGRNRSEALRSLSKRTGVDDLNTFVTAVIQADQLGSNIANMLRVQSMSARTRRRQRIEQAVAKLPVKMIFPLVFFFLPAIFIIILGPALLNVLEALSGTDILR